MPDPDVPAWARRGPSRGELSDEELAAFIGPRWEPTYKRKLAPFRDDPSFVPTWNWAAFLFPNLWFLYRKLYLAFAVFLLIGMLVVPMVLGSDNPLTFEELRKPENAWFLRAYFAIEVSVRLAAGGSGNWLLYRRARAAHRLVSSQSLPSDSGRALMTRIGGINRTGAALVALVVAVSMLAQAWGAAPK